MARLLRSQQETRPVNRNRRLYRTAKIAQELADKLAGLLMLPGEG